MKMEPARTFPDAIVTARCIDCDREFTGPIGLRNIECADGPGIEIVVVCRERNEMHSIARVKRHLVPTVQLATAPGSHIGHA